ncbi:MAG: SRPBCC family protein [Candidatus Promineifilaceae bacterium]|nr:SRPBCC family protein [Candidatus Promineifilaceae bacterium]
MHIEESILIDRPIEAVWEYTTDIHNFPQWQTDVKEIRKLTEGPVGAGTRAVDVREMFGRKMEQTMEITTFDPPHRFEARSVEGPMEVEVAYLFEPAGDSTRVKTVVDGEPGGLFKLAGPVLKMMASRQTRGELGKLKEILEGQKGGGYG